MPTVTLYDAGTADFTNGSANVVGHGTVWATLIGGDVIRGPDLRFYEITPVDDTHFTLDRNYVGTTAAGAVGGTDWYLFRSSMARDSVRTASKQLTDIASTYRTVISLTSADQLVRLSRVSGADRSGIILQNAGNDVFRIGMMGTANYAIQYLVGGIWTDAFKVDAATGAVTISSLTLFTIDNSFSGKQNFTNATEATGTGTVASVLVGGGAEIAKKLFVGGDFNVGGGKFVVTAASGALSMQGDLTLGGGKFAVTAANGNTAIVGTLGVTGNVAVNTNKFTVNATTGDTVIAGGLSMQGQLTVSGFVGVGAGLTCNGTTAAQFGLFTSTLADTIANFGFASLYGNANAGNYAVTGFRSTVRAGVAGMATFNHTSDNNYSIVGIYGWAAPGGHGAHAVAGMFDRPDGAGQASGHPWAVLMAGGAPGVTAVRALTIYDYTAAAETFYITPDGVLSSLSVAGTTTLTGAATASGTLNAVGNFTVNTSKFIVNATTGNAAIAGTLALTSDLTINTNKLTVTGATGNIVSAGSLSIASDFVVNTNKFTVASATGNMSAGTLTGKSLALTYSLVGNGVVTINNTDMSGTFNVDWSIGQSAVGATSWYFLAMRSGGSSDNEFLFRGDGSGFCDGSWIGGGADYAEFFEWLDGNPNKEDRRGLSVVLVGKKIRVATTLDSPSAIIGVVSARPTVIGDAAPMRWKDKYIRDEYGAEIMQNEPFLSWTEVNDEGKEISHRYFQDSVPEGIIVPWDAVTSTEKRRVLNPAYNPDAPYIPREDRPEWSAIGLMGKLVVRVGQAIGANWIKLEDISPASERWLIRP